MRERIISLGALARNPIPREAEHIAHRWDEFGDRRSLVCLARADNDLAILRDHNDVPPFPCQCHVVDFSGRLNRRERYYLGYVVVFDRDMEPAVVRYEGALLNPQTAVESRLNRAAHIMN